MDVLSHDRFRTEHPGFQFVGKEFTQTQRRQSVLKNTVEIFKQAKPITIASKCVQQNIAFKLLLRFLPRNYFSI